MSGEEHTCDCGHCRCHHGNQTNATCWWCGGQLIWESDFPMDEVYGEEYSPDGIVTYLHCADCGACVTYETPIPEEQD